VTLRGAGSPGLRRGSVAEPPRDVAEPRAQLGDQRRVGDVGLSVRTFHRRCLERLATTPAKLIDKLRVEHARTLLASTAMPAKALAAACGFGSPAQLNRAFERQLGIGPREYRVLHGQAPAHSQRDSFAYGNVKLDELTAARDLESLTTDR
jgi:AraC-like DNA-binding protein